MILEDDRYRDLGGDRAEVIADALLVWCRFAMRGDHQSCGAKVGRHLAEQDRGGSSAVAGSDDHGEITGSFDRALYDGSAFSVDQTVCFAQDAEDGDAVDRDVAHECDHSGVAVEVDGFVFSEGSWEDGEDAGKSHFKVKWQVSMVSSEEQGKVQCRTQNVECRGLS